MEFTKYRKCKEISETYKQRFDTTITEINLTLITNMLEKACISNRIDKLTIMIWYQEPIAELTSSPLAEPTD